MKEFCSELKAYPSQFINDFLQIIFLMLAIGFRIIDLVSHTTHVVCVNFIREWGDIQFKVDSERQIFFEKLFMALNYSQSFCQKSAKRKSPKKYFSYFVLMSGLGLELPSNKPTHYLLDHGDLFNLLLR